MKQQAIFRSLFLVLLSLTCVPFSLLVGSWRQKQSLLRLEREAKALGFAYHVFVHSERRARMLGRFGDTDIDVEVKSGLKPALELVTRLNVRLDRLTAEGAWVDAELQRFQRKQLGFFGEALIIGDGIRVRYEGFSTLYPIVWPETLHRLSSNLVELARRITRHLGAVRATSDFQQLRFFDAVQSGDIAAVTFAVRTGSAAAQVDGDGRGALHHLSIDNEEDPQALLMAEFLLDAGADPNVSNVDGVTPLMVAAEAGYTQIVTLLLQRGAKVTPRDAMGHTALTLATEENHDEVAKVLRAAGAT